MEYSHRFQHFPRFFQLNVDPAKEDKFLKIREKFNEKVQKLPGVQVPTRPILSQRSFSSKIFFLLRRRRPPSSGPSSTAPSCPLRSPSTWP